MIGNRNHLKSMTYIGRGKRRSADTLSKISVNSQVVDKNMMKVGKISSGKVDNPSMIPSTINLKTKEDIKEQKEMILVENNDEPKVLIQKRVTRNRSYKDIECGIFAQSILSIQTDNQRLKDRFADYDKDEEDVVKTSKSNQLNIIDSNKKRWISNNCFEDKENRKVRAWDKEKYWDHVEKMWKSAHFEERPTLDSRRKGSNKKEYVSPYVDSRLSSKEKVGYSW